MTHPEKMEWVNTLAPEDILLPDGGLFDVLHEASFEESMEIILGIGKRNDNTPCSNLVKAFEIFFECPVTLHGLHRGPEDVKESKLALARHHAKFIKETA